MMHTWAGITGGIDVRDTSRVLLTSPRRSFLAETSSRFSTNPDPFAPRRDGDLAASHRSKRIEKSPKEASFPANARGRNVLSLIESQTGCDKAKSTRSGEARRSS